MNYPLFFLNICQGYIIYINVKLFFWWGLSKDTSQTVRILTEESFSQHKVLHKCHSQVKSLLILLSLVLHKCHTSCCTYAPVNSLTPTPAPMSIN